MLPVNEGNYFFKTQRVAPLIQMDVCDARDPIPAKRRIEAGNGYVNVADLKLARRKSAPIHLLEQANHC